MVYYTWLGFITITVVVLMTLYCSAVRVFTLPQSWSSASVQLQKWLDTTCAMDTSTTAAHRQHTLRLYTDIAKTCAVCGALILIVFLPLYGLLKLKYGTHEYQDAWTVSEAYQTRTLATALELTALFCMLAAMLVLVMWLRGSNGANDVTEASITQVSTHKDDLRAVAGVCIAEWRGRRGCKYRFRVHRIERVQRGAVCVPDRNRII